MEGFLCFLVLFSLTFNMFETRLSAVMLDGCPADV